MKYKDYYAALGLERGASAEEVKKAYRRLARKFHPDVSKETGAEERFKDVAEAYQTLKDPAKRAAYDQLGSHAPGQDFRPSNDWQEQWRQQFGDAPHAGGGPNSDAGAQFSEEIDLSDLFAHLGARRGGGRGGAHAAMPGQDYEIAVPITVEQAFAGTQINLDLNVPEYDEAGRLRRVPRAFRARIPRGASEGQRLRIPGKGGKGFQGGRDGDLYLDIRLTPHRLYRVSGHDLYLDLPLAPWEAVLGASVEVPTPGGRVRMKVPAGARAGQQLRLPARGLPTPRGEAGDLYAVVQVVLPETVSESERELYQKLAAGSTFEPRLLWAQEGDNAN